MNTIDEYKLDKIENLIIYNEMIAVFMNLSKAGYFHETLNKFVHTGWYDARIELPDYERFNGGRSLHSKELKYHSSWEWLWSAVEKIQLSAHIKIENTQCLITENGVLISGILNGTNKENVYWAVVQYIKWNNEKNSINHEKSN